MRNRSYVITADFTVPADGAEGVIVANGGADGGFTLCMLEGRLHYVSSFLGHEHSVVSSDAVSAGPHTASVEFERTGGRAARARLLIDGAAGEGEIPRTNPIAFATAEGLSIGSDPTSPVWPAYRPPFRFTGEISRVTIEVYGQHR